MSRNVFRVGHVSTADLFQRKVLDRVNRRNFFIASQLHRFTVAGIAVEFFRPGSLGLGGTEPFGKGFDDFGLLVGPAFLIQDAQILGNIIGTVVNVDKVPVLGGDCALQGVRIVGIFRRCVNVAVQRGRENVET